MDTPRQGVTKDPANSLHVRRQPIHTNQQRPGQGAGADLAHQALKQRPVALWRHHPAQPEARGDLQRGGHPHLQPLQLDPQFVRLHLAQITRLRDQMFMHLFALRPGPRVPVGHRALIQAEGHDNRLQRATMRQQRDHQGHRLFSRAQAEEGRPLAGGKGLAAFPATVAAFLPAVDRDIALANLPPCRTVPVRAEYRLRIHGARSLPSQKGLCRWIRFLSRAEIAPTTA